MPTSTTTDEPRRFVIAGISVMRCMCGTVRCKHCGGVIETVCHRDNPVMHCPRCGSSTTSTSLNPQEAPGA